MAVDLNCPACGAAAPSRLRYAKLLVCPHCQTSLFLEDEAVRNVGERAALTEMPSLLTLGHRFRFRHWRFETYGRVRFDYGDGIWDEWWVVLDDGEGRWVSVDEGDIAIEGPLPYEGTVPSYDALRIGATVTFAEQQVTISEKNESTCIGLEGELPEVIRPGDIHRYVHLSGPRGLLLTLEFHDGKVDAYKGIWVDPFEIEAL